MKLAIVGSGMIVKELLIFINDIPNIKLVTIIGRKKSEEKLKKLTKEAHIERYSFDYEEELKNKDIDTVYIALPNHLHYEYAKKALLAKKHVICEKPFTLKSSELKELIFIAQKNNVILLEAITNQYLANFHYIKNNLSKLGDIKIVSFNYSQYSSRYDAFKNGIIAPVFDSKQGGGALLDLNIYNIHLAIGLFGMPINANYLANIEKEIDTSGILTLQYKDKKIVCIAAKDCDAKIISTIQGDKGSITINGATNAIPSVTIELRDGFRDTVSLDNEKHRMINEFLKFEEVIRTKDYIFVEKMLKHSLCVMEIIDMIK